jgi:prophage tail gpP-like protein
MAFETITLMVGGAPLLHRRCTLTASAEQAVRQASFDLAYTGPSLPCREDAAATVLVGGALWLTGYTRDLNWAHDAETRTYSVSVVSRTVDATEASIDHPTGFLENCDLAAIGKEFDTANIGVECMVQAVKKGLHQIIPGETLFATLERETRARGALISDTPQGKLRITDKPEGRHAGVLQRGVNILRASGTLSGRYNYDKVKVRGQASFGTRGGALSPEAEARGTADRKRTLIIYHEGEVESGRLKKRAGWEAKRAAGQGTSARITLAGCRDAGGMVWTPNRLVSVMDDWGGLAQDMVIASLQIEQDAEGGTTTELTLKDPRALGGENPRGDSAPGWGAPGEAEPEYRED